MLDKLKVYEYMYYDLLSNQLEVCLVPSINPDRAGNGCCARAVVQRNPKWYRDFCALFLDTRGKTFIKRRNVLRALNRLKDGKTTRFRWRDYLEDINETLQQDLNITETEADFFAEYGEMPTPFTDQF